MSQISHQYLQYSPKPGDVILKYQIKTVLHLSMVFISNVQFYYSSIFIEGCLAIIIT
jgi:hypothetical protein